jgi:hypothetical protein
MYLYMYVSMHVSTHVCINVCIYVSIFVCIYVCMHEHKILNKYAHLFPCKHFFTKHGKRGRLRMRHKDIHLLKAVNESSGRIQIVIKMSCFG